MISTNEGQIIDERQGVIRVRCRFATECAGDLDLAGWRSVARRAVQRSHTIQIDGNAVQVQSGYLWSHPGDASLRPVEAELGLVDHGS